MSASEAWTGGRGFGPVPQGLHLMEEDLADAALDNLAQGGIDSLLAFLAKHTAFAAYLHERGLT